MYIQNIQKINTDIKTTYIRIGLSFLNTKLKEKSQNSKYFRRYYHLNFAPEVVVCNSRIIPESYMTPNILRSVFPQISGNKNSTAYSNEFSHRSENKINYLIT